MAYLPKLSPPHRGGHLHSNTRRSLSDQTVWCGVFLLSSKVAHCTFNQPSVCSMKAPHHTHKSCPKTTSLPVLSTPVSKAVFFRSLKPGEIWALRASHSISNTSLSILLQKHLFRGSPSFQPHNSKLPVDLNYLSLRLLLDYCFLVALLSLKCSFLMIA